MTKLRYQHFATTNVTMALGKDFQCLLKSFCERMKDCSMNGSNWWALTNWSILTSQKEADDHIYLLREVHDVNH